MAGTKSNTNRRPHNKTKSGCITCKVRRIKCDETKPACTRCTSTGRKCDGYDRFEVLGDLSPPRAHGRDYPTLKLQMPFFSAPFAPSRPILQRHSAAECRSLEYFNDRTIPTLGGLIDTRVWTTLLRQVGDKEPAIKHAMMALSALHEQSETEGLPLPEAPGLAPPPGEDPFALRHYTRAIGLLRHRLTTGEQSHTVTLLSCLLFITLEFLRGNTMSAITHLRAGLDIIRSRLPSKDASNPLQQRLTPVDVVEGALAPTFARLSLLQSLYGQPRSCAFGIAGRGPFVEFLDMDLGTPGVIESVDQARLLFVNLCNAVFRFIFMVDYSYFPFIDAFYETQNALLAQCDSWDLAIHVFQVTHSLTAVETRGTALLQAHNLMARMWVLHAPTISQNYVHDAGQCDFDSFLPNFERVYELMARVLSPLQQSPIETSPPSFALDNGLLPLLFFAAIKCRHRTLRRKFVGLVRKSPKREGLWSAEEVIKVTELVIDVEETPIAGLSGEVYPPEESRIADLDIRSRDPINPKAQEVKMKMKPHGLDGEAVWKSAWIYWD